VKYHQRHDNKVIFVDNIDPYIIETIITDHDLEQCGFIVISKSGMTLEVISLFYLFTDLFKQRMAEYDFSQNFIAITEVSNNNKLYQFACEHNITVIPHDEDIGGRFSVFSVVGMLPALLDGVNITKVRAGAADLLQDLQDHSSLSYNMLIDASSWQYVLENNGYNQLVVMPYSDELFYFNYWFRQLWAESLGKNGCGSTPINASGTCDQHSQLQLYLAGKNDKSYIFLGTKNLPVIPVAIDVTTMEQKPQGISLGDIMNAEYQATINSLVEKGRAVYQIEYEILDEWAIGHLMAFMLVKTLVMAELYGISPYGQPEVERGKILAKEYLCEKV
jgi:glucose-6-phosphate isomerase